MSFDNVNVNVSGPVKPTAAYKTKVLKGNHSFASQVTEPNTKYVIKYNFDLGGDSVTIPEGCLLEFDGGVISNGTLVGQSTFLIYNQPLNYVLTATLEGIWKPEAVDVEKTRAEEAESTLSGRIDTIEEAVGTGGSVDSRISNAVAVETERAQAAEDNLRGQKQDVLIFDSFPTANSNNPVKSSGIKSSLDSLYAVYTGLTDSDIIVGSLPLTGTANKIYRVPGDDEYSDYMWDGSNFVKIATGGVDYASFVSIKNLLRDWKDADFYLPGYVDSTGVNTVTLPDWRIAIIRVEAGDEIVTNGMFDDPFRCGYTDNLPSSGFTLDYILPTDTPRAPNKFISPRGGYLCISGHNFPTVQAKNIYKDVLSGMPKVDSDYQSTGYYVDESGLLHGETFTSRLYPLQGGKTYIIHYYSLQGAYDHRGGTYLVGFAWIGSSLPTSRQSDYYINMYSENIDTIEFRPLSDGYLLMNGGYDGGMYPYFSVFEKESIYDFSKEFSELQNEISNSLYTNKTCLYIGDSISTGNNYFWKGFLEDNYKLKYVRDRGSSNLPAADGGITVIPAEQEGDNPTIWYRCAQNRMSVYTFDIISLFGGTNDLTDENLEIGEITDIPFVDNASSITSETVTDVRPQTLTFASALMGCVLMLKRDFPDKEIVIPTVLYYGGNFGGWIYKDTGLLASEVMAILQMKIAQKYGLKGIPLYWDMKNPNTAMVFSIDSVHPNAQGALRIQAVFAQTLCLK